MLRDFSFFILPILIISLLWPTAVQMIDYDNAMMCVISLSGPPADEYENATVKRNKRCRIGGKTLDGRDAILLG